MTLTPRTNLLRALQTRIPRGAPFDIETLRSLGISSALAWHYADAGWITRLGRGLFMFPNDELDRDACLKFLVVHSPGLHVGGKTALAWRGVRHNLLAREQIWLWGERPMKLPEWFTSRFQARYVARHLFREELPDPGIQPLPEKPDGPPVSVPERALLEMLSEVGMRQSIEEARNIMEGVRSVRPETLQELLKNCLRRKVTLLCVQWAEELGLAWAPAARKAVGGSMAGSRWTARYKSGTTLNLKV